MGWFIQEAKKRGIAVSLSDYTLGSPGQGGKGRIFFFSDELNFNIRGRLWNVFFADEFQKRKGYDIRPDLYLVFEEDCPEAVKIRLDYYDVIVQLEEENYFGPVFQWHEDRGMTYGCDHGGRGKDVTEFGDYMRTQKYNQGPGCDQSGLQSDIIKNKVATSIVHLYQRPRVWVEDFYYSTYGGFWEWAPPCNCVRMPYWKDMEKLTGAVERLTGCSAAASMSAGSASYILRQPWKAESAEKLP